MSDNAELLAGLAAHLTLLALPGAAAAVLAARRGVRGVPVLLAVALAASGVAALLAFWAYYAGPVVGQTWDFFLLGGSVLAVVWVWREGRLDRAILGPLAVPLGLWVFATCFVVFLGFLHGGNGEAVAISAFRFSGQLPSDNDIPRFFAEWFASHGHESPPPVYPGEWQMSDRPPLQVGYVLSQRALFPTERALHYEILCAGVQSLWIVGMWAVLCAARVRALTRGLAIVAALVSDVAIVHGFFVWPKLIAAAFVFAALALVISPAWSRNRHDLRVAALIGALLALAMLAHGSSVFAVVPLVALAAFRGMPRWRWLGVAAVAGLALFLPWTAYQNYADPPGDRLVKWHLGGDIGPDSRGALEAIVDGYGEAGWEGTLDNKAANFGEMVGWSRAKDGIEAALDALEQGKPGLAAAVLREVRFFALLPFLGLLLIGPAAMIVGRRRERDAEEWRFALLCFAFCGVACLFWGLLMFGALDSRTGIPSGSLAVPLLALVGCVAGLRAIHPRLAAALVAVNASLVLVLYAPSLTPLPGSAYSPFAALLALASLAGFAFLAFSRDAGGAAAVPRGR